MAAALLKMLMQRDFGLTDPEEDPIEQGSKNFEARPRRDDRREPRSDYRNDTRGDDRKDRNGKRKERTASPRQQGQMTRLFFNIGSKMQVQPRDMVGAIAGETGIAGKIIGAIEIHERFSFVDVPVNVADEVMNIMNGCQIRGFKVAVEKAAPKS